MRIGWVVARLGLIRCRPMPAMVVVCRRVLLAADLPLAIGRLLIAAYYLPPLARQRRLAASYCRPPTYSCPTRASAPPPVDRLFLAVYCRPRVTCCCVQVVS